VDTPNPGEKTRSEAMKHPRLRRLTPPTMVTALVLLTACSHRHRDNHYYPVETYAESEVNDTVPTADYFGLLYPGDHFHIEGHITDIPYDPFDPWNGYDPYDGFAFTAAVPIHVEFSLWIDDILTDLDVIVYDPQLDQDVGFFETANNPETGTVQVYAGNLDFHLVVAPYIGSSTYDLEIRVFHLFPLTGDAPAAERSQNITASSTVDPDRPAREADLLEGYRLPAVIDDEHALEVLTHTKDPITETEETTSRTLDADG